MKTGSEVEAHVVLKAAEDTEFRARLIDDPKGVIEAETGKVLPDDMLVFVKQAIENSLESPENTNKPLTNDELTQVMGGNCDHVEGAPEEWHNCEE